MDCERCGCHFLAFGAGVVCNDCLRLGLGNNPREEDFEGFEDFFAAESAFDAAFETRMAQLQ
jgi:hypothetical protein